MKNIGILNYGIGNLLSLYNSFTYLNANIKIVSDPKKIKYFDLIILPGVGSFNQAMCNLREYNFIENLDEHVLEKKKYLLGICLGMQLIGKSSNEKTFTKGLNYTDYISNKIIRKKNFPVPHVGFNQIKVIKNSYLFNNIENNSDFYFTHSFKIPFKQNNKHIAKTKYSIDFTCVYEFENIIATQFHPEKSQINGIKLLKNILDY